MLTGGEILIFRVGQNKKNKLNEMGTANFKITIKKKKYNKILMKF